MAYKQTYAPNINVPARRGWCLGYVDDAIKAPSRTVSATVAFNNERNARRISLATPPKNVWLIGFVSFAKGEYAPYGHIFLFRYLGTSWEIHDSEVHSGARAPYRSISELLTWFGASGPTYLGWSTTCDGRTIAKEESMALIGNNPAWKERARKSFKMIRNRDMSDAEFKPWIGKDFLHLVEALEDNKEANQAYADQQLGKKARLENWEKKLATTDSSFTADDRSKLKAIYDKLTSVFK